MFEQVFGFFLLVFGYITGGSVRGDATQSAVFRSDIVVLENTYTTKRKTFLSQWESKRASFSAVLVQVKDEKKRTTLEAMQNRLNEIHTNQIHLLMLKLKRMSLGVEEIQKAVTEYKKEHATDISTLTKAIEDANDAIAEAMVLLTAQSDKTYFTSFTSETSVKKEFQNEKNRLVADLAKIREASSNAQKKVMTALQSFRTLTGVTESFFIPSQENTVL
jgi:hypothetical protein